MTREEQRIEEAKNRFSDDQIYPISKMYAFVEGVKWADEHPKPEMVNKQEFIEKACEWLLNNAHLYVYATTKEKRALMFDNFKKAMEE